MRTIVWLVGVAFVALGAVLLLAPSFGFETIAADRTADLGSAADENATIGFEAAGGSIDAPDDEATVFRLRNNAGETLTLANSHLLSVDGLAVGSDGDGTVASGDYSTVSVYCGDYRGTDTVTLTVTVDEASGTTLTIRGASSAASFVADCNVPALVWNATADWDAGSDDRTVSDDVGDRQSDTVQLGYGTDDAGLVGYWPLDEDGGTTAVDASGNGNDGTHVNSPSVGATGLLNSTTYEFDHASDQYVEVPNSSSLQVESEDRVTVSAWIKMDEVRTDVEYSAITQKSDTGFNLQLANWGTEPTFTVHDGGYRIVNSGVNLNAGEWHHLVGTYDGDTATIYVDGTAENSLSGIGQMSDTSGWNVGIGENLDQTGRQFDGRIDEVRVYDRWLSAAEVRDLYYTADNGTHTTDWRSPSVDLHADRLVLKNVTATLAGTNATVYVESDTDGDGEPDETSDAIAIAEDAAEYDVTGIATDTDRVRLRAEFETGNVTRTPIVSRADLTEEYSNFTVAIDDADGTVVEGEDLAVDVTVENTGTDPDTQTLELRDFDGDVVDTTDVQLDARSSTSTTLTWSTQSGDADTGDVTVASHDANATQSVTVQQQATFDVTIDGTTSPVDETEPLDVDVTVQNTGDVSGTKTVRLEDFGGTQVDARNVTLGGGQTNDSIALAWQTADGDSGTGDVTVHSDDDSDAAQATVNDVFFISDCSDPEADVDVDGTYYVQNDLQYDGTNACITITTEQAVVEGQNHTITVTDASGYGIDENDFEIGGDYVFRDLTIDGGDRSIRASWVDDLRLENVTLRNAALGIKSFNNHNTDAKIALVDTTFYDTSNVATALQGDASTVEVTATRTTFGDPADNGTTLDFTGAPSGGDLGIDEVESPAAAPTDNVSIGRYVELDSVPNGLQNVVVHYDEDDVANLGESTVALWRYESSQSTWTQLDSTVDAENDTVSVASDLTSTTTFGLFARDRPAFDVSIDDTSEPLDEGEPLDVTVTVENLGDREDTQTIALENFDGDVVDATDVTLGAGETDGSVALTWQTQQGDNGSDDVAVSSATATATRQVQIGDGSEFQVAIDAVHEPVTEGEALDVDVTAENVGDQAGTQTLRLRDFDGTVVDSTEVALGAGETNASITLTWSTTAGDGGSGTLEVSSADEVATASATVQQPTDVDVAIDGTSSPVGEGDDLDVDVALENTGDVEGTQTVTLEDLAGSQVDSQTVTLSPGEQRSIALTWATQTGDNGTGDVTVASENDSVTRQVTIEEVHVVTSCMQIAEDGRYVLDGDVVYSGSGPCIDIQTGRATFDGRGHTVDMGSASQRAFSAHRWSAPGNYTFRDLTIDGGSRGFHLHFVDRADVADVTVRNADVALHTYNNDAVGQDSGGDVTVSDATFYAASTSLAYSEGNLTDLVADRLTLGDPAGNGSTLSFELHSTGNTTELGAASDSLRSPPDGNESVGGYFGIERSNDPVQNVTLHYDGADVGDLDESSLALWRDDGSWTRLDSTVDEASDTVSVASNLTAETDFGAFAGLPPAFEVAIQSTTSPVTEGEALGVTVDVTNNGDASDTQTVELADLDGAVVDQTDVQVAAGATETETLTWSTAGGDEGTGDVTVSSTSDSDSAPVEVADGSTFDVTIDQAHDGIVEGEDLDVDVSVTNDGGVTDTETVELTGFDGTVVDSTDVTLGANETNSSVTLTWSTEAGDNATGDVNVTSDEDVETQQVTIDQQATFDVAITGANDPVTEGQDLVVDAEVTNTGDRSGTQTVELEDFGGQQVDATDVTLGASETNNSITLVWSTGDGDGGSGDVTVRSDDASAAQTVTIEQPANFDVTIDGTSSPVEEGQGLTVDVSVTNTGDDSGTQTIELTDFGGTVVDSTDVTLGGGETDSSIALTWSTQSGDAGSGDVTVSSENESETVGVQVDQAGLVAVTDVAANVSFGEGQQYVEFTITDAMESDDKVDIPLTDATDDVTYDYRDDSLSPLVVEGGEYVHQDSYWRFDAGGPVVRLVDPVAGETVRLELDQFSTSGPSGPHSVQFDHRDGESWTDEFSIVD